MSVLPSHAAPQHDKNHDRSVNVQFDFRRRQGVRCVVYLQTEKKKIIITETFFFNKYVVLGKKNTKLKTNIYLFKNRLIFVLISIRRRENIMLFSYSLCFKDKQCIPTIFSKSIRAKLLRHNIPHKRNIIDEFVCKAILRLKNIADVSMNSAPSTRAGNNLLLYYFSGSVIILNMTI